ncbi:glycoside hydrolase family 9 protein [bacterium]|nr:glycoside hydrolase family 9 protein [bacterium]
MPDLKYFTAFLCFTAILTASEPDLRINDSEYFECPGLNVMVFHDFYPEGHQGGVTIIQHGERVVANGDLRLEPSPGQWQPIPKMGKRTIHRDRNEIEVSLSFPDSSRDKKGFNPIDYPDLHFAYTVRVAAEGKRFRIIVDLEAPLPAEWIGRIGFNLELFPGMLFGKMYTMDDQSGLFPPQANGPMTVDAQDEVQILPMAEGRILTIAPESEARRCTIESLQEPLLLIDGRGIHNNGWFIVRSLIPENTTRNAVEWIVTPSLIPGWKSAPVIHISQIGYHPDQRKIAVIETDKRDDSKYPVILSRIQPDGQKTEILKKQPESWGDFLRYTYYQFDFTEITDPGIYRLNCGDSDSEPFRIDKNVYQRHVWQPTLEYFLPVQMCHMKVMDKYRVWHGLCHMDDALMAPINHNHFDGYSQGPATLTDFQPGDPVPGLNQGGWHDAGDYDLRVESQAGTVHMLSLAYEAFHVDEDATTVDQKHHLVEIHQPDGKPDMLQQIEHGVLAILGGYQSLGRLYRGIICPTLRQYVLLGDGSTMTDNRVYDAALDEHETDGFRSGVRDDRWVFTEENPRRELQVAASLAAAARVLKHHDPALSARCLSAAGALWDSNKQSDARFKINAAAELWFTTNEETYKNFLTAQKEFMIRGLRWNAPIIGRIVPALDDPDLTRFIREAMVEYKKTLDEQKTRNPFGVPFEPRIWGAGWGIQNFGVGQYFLHKGFPDIFPEEDMLNALNFVLGCHPGSNTASFASGVGSRSILVAYGVNRADWSYIPGGVVSGTALIRPDLPELKEWPFFWQQTEYVMGGGASNFLFLVLAADYLLNGDH